jgi:hypothetical protein
MGRLVVIAIEVLRVALGDDLEQRGRGFGGQR